MIEVTKAKTSLAMLEKPTGPENDPYFLFAMA